MAFLFNEDDVKKVLAEAYEAGWRGCLEMKGEYVEKAVQDLCEHKVPEKHAPIVWDGITSSSSGPWYSSYNTYVFSTDSRSGT